MTVNPRCSLFLFGLFLARACGAHITDNTHCPSPYSCIPTSECAERHSARGIEEVLFQCEEKKKVCCPALKLPTRDGSPQGVNKQEPTEPTRTKDCTPNPYQPHRQQVVTNEYPVRKNTTATAPQRHQQGTDQKRHPPQESTHRPEIPTSRPQKFPTLSQRPQTPQPPLQLQRPPNVKPLSSHKNFKLLPPESHCGVNNFANRITEGEEVSLGEYPWMVLTGLKDEYGNTRWNCGGTLINGWYVLTAAHCLVVFNRTIEFVRLGEHSLANVTDCSREVCLDPPEDVAIAEVIPHERWNTTTIKNDIALLRLSRNPLKLGKSNIYPICLPVDADKLNITSNTKYEVAGWGKTYWSAEEGSDVLRKASISGVNREECNICKGNKKQQYCPITDTQLCVQGWKSVDVCKGDSGGPLMVTRLNIYQIGITSFKGSEYCGAENIPSIFTKIESYLPWILDNIRE